MATYNWLMKHGRKTINYTVRRLTAELMNRARCGRIALCAVAAVSLLGWDWQPAPPAAPQPAPATGVHPADAAHLPPEALIPSSQDRPVAPRNPGAVMRPHGPAVIYWDFEPNEPSGRLEGWTGEGGWHPIACGRIDPSRLPNGGSIAADIGGDYWRNSFWPGQSGNCYVDTSQHVGSLASPEFTYDGTFRYVSFLLGGGSAQSWVKLQVLSTSPPPAGLVPQGVPHAGGQAPAGLWIDLKVAKGPGTLGMGTVVWDLSTIPAAKLTSGAKLRLLIYGKGAGMLIDNVQTSVDQPALLRPPVWGFADLHAHLFNHMGFGGVMFHGAIHSMIPASGLHGGPAPAHSDMAAALNNCQAAHGKPPDFVSSDGVMTLFPEMGHTMPDTNAISLLIFPNIPEVFRSIPTQQWWKDARAGGTDTEIALYGAVQAEGGPDQHFCVTRP